MKIQYEHWNLIAHSLGINLYHAIHSKNYKDKQLPNEFYRNYFCSSKSGESFNLLKELESMGLTESNHQNGNVYFKVTDKCIVSFREYFYEEVTDKFKKPTKSQMRYQDYLHLDSEMSFMEYLQSPYCLK